MDSMLRIVLPPLILGIIFIVFQKLFPSKKSKHTTAKSLEELTKEYRKYDSIFLILFFCLTIPFGIAYGFLFQKIGQILNEPMIENGGILIQPSFLAWMIAGFLAGMITFGLVGTPISKAILKDRESEYLAYNDLKYNYDTEKVTNIAAAFLTLFALLIVASIFDNFSYFGKEKLKLNGIFGFGTSHYKYEEIEKVKSIKLLRNDVYTESNWIDITFKDGYKWHSVDDGYNDYEKDLQIVKLVIKKTGLNLEYEERERD
ncbi:hypothetical protein [Aureispira anguillae]|uniref:Uncharacterized protein n=1 Tax=Aureispira anguillae TaxID=2864201 RepID=A0A915YCG1_9BACT|nr:hypothetical protein [Aureispira anguillae]BDS10538.1 hypothetical protein AsAng_0012460 [Aureispira anguillae]